MAIPLMCCTILSTYVGLLQEFPTNEMLSVHGPNTMFHISDNLIQSPFRTDSIEQGTVSCSRRRARFRQSSRGAGGTSLLLEGRRGFLLGTDFALAFLHSSSLLLISDFVRSQASCLLPISTFLCSRLLSGVGMLWSTFPEFQLFFWLVFEGPATDKYEVEWKSGKPGGFGLSGEEIGVQS